MDYMSTYKGYSVNPLAIESDKINIEDIAHALSLLCRGGGHLNCFYSVGQHCINCAYEAQARGYSKSIQLACLIHDASEAYLSDIIRPVKKQLPAYIEIEDKLLEVIYAKFIGTSIASDILSKVKEIDDALLTNELHQFFSNQSIELTPLKSSPDFNEYHWKDVEKRYINLFDDLYLLSR